MWEELLRYQSSLDKVSKNAVAVSLHTIDILPKKGSAGGQPPPTGFGAFVELTLT